MWVFLHQIHWFYACISKIDGINKIDLTNQTKFRLKEISRIENYFSLEINQIKLFCKTLSKYVTAFDCIDKILILLLATTGRVCIVSHPTVVGPSVGIATAGFL